MSKELQSYINECREMLESKGETCPLYVGFEKETYTLTRQEIQSLARCLYLIDNQLNQNKYETDSNSSTSDNVLM